jgi:hypothetical protein
MAAIQSEEVLFTSHTKFVVTILQEIQKLVESKAVSVDGESLNIASLVAVSR